MLTFILENLASLLIGLALLVLVIAVVAFLIKNKRKGGSSCSCGGDCANCPMGGISHKEK